MSPPLSRRKLLAIGSVTSASLLTGCQGFGNPARKDDSGSDDRENAFDSNKLEEGDNESLGLAYSRGSTSFQSDEGVHSGWVHIVSDGESADLTFDARFCDAVGEVKPILSRSGSDEYVLRFETGEGSSEKTSSGASDTGPTCNSGTRIVGGANVPSDWETLIVAADNREIQTVKRSGTMPELRPLPDPIQV